MYVAWEAGPGWHFCRNHDQWIWLQALEDAGGVDKALSMNFPGNSWVLPKILGQDYRCLVCQWAYVTDWFRAHSLKERVSIMSWHLRARILKIRASLEIDVPDLELEKVPESGPRKIEPVRKSMNPEGSEMEEMKKDPVLW